LVADYRSHFSYLLPYHFYLLRVYIEPLELHSQSSHSFNSSHCKAYIITSLYKINWIINKREEKLAKETNKELVKRLLPTIYTGYKDIFLKAALDELPPY